MTDKYIYPKNIDDLPEEDSVERWEYKEGELRDVWLPLIFTPVREMIKTNPVRYIPKQPVENLEVAAANYADNNAGILKEHENLYQAFKAGAAWVKSQEEK